MPPAIQANTTFFLYLFLIAFSLLPHETCIPYTHAPDTATAIQAERLIPAGSTQRINNITPNAM